MATAQSFTKTGSKSSSITLDSSIFGLDVASHTLLKQAYLTHLANGRTNNATTQTRSQVQGGGRKPWRQKGTGRARAGSIRSPLWKGGAVTFGPTGKENYSKKLNAKSRQLALRQALSLKNQEKAVSVIELIESKEGKTKPIAELVAKLTSARPVLLIVDNKSPELVRATNNIPYVTLKEASYLNVFEALNARAIIITKPALKGIVEKLKGSQA